MAVRTFVDARGAAWTVWEVRPGETSILGSSMMHHLRVRPQFTGGWLAFRADDPEGGDGRRLAPIPAGWEEAGEAELAAYVAAAVVA